MRQRSGLGLRQVAGAVVSSLAVVLFLAASPASAQAPGDRVRRELERTDEGLERAAAVVKEGDSARARDVLDRATAVQTDAWGNFHGARLVVATRLTLEARAMAARAVSLAREDSSVRERAQREMDRAAQMISRARDESGEHPSAQAPPLLDDAGSLLDRAHATFGEQHFVAALRLALASQRLAAQATSLGGPGGVRGPARDLERTDHLLERVQTLVAESDNADAARLFEQARTAQDAAWEAFRAGKPREAHVRTRAARDLGNRVRLMLGGEDLATAPDVLRETQVVIDRAAEVIAKAGDDRAQAVLDRASDHQTRAQASLSAGDVRRALAQTRVARQLAKRALELVGEPGTSR
ncbi:MAG: hypothetical protein U0167_09700 [bacterium]